MRDALAKVQVQVDSDDLDDVLVELEKSFEVKLPRDLTHVRTAGDLFTEITKLREADGAGDRCQTAMAYYILRDRLSEQGLAGKITPQTKLKGANLPSPRQFGRMLGLQVPGIMVSRKGCLACLAIFLSAIALAVITGSYAWLTLWLLALPVLALDQGQWAGDWGSAGSLARAIAIRNVAYFAGRGARNREQDWWRSFSHLLSTIAFAKHTGSPVTSDQIGPQTRFEFH